MKKPAPIILYFLLSFLLFPFVLFSQKDNRKWETSISINNESFVMTTFLDIKNIKEKTLLTSPKNADIRIFGGFKARMGRMLGKSPKKGIFISIDCIQKGDSLYGDVYSPFFSKMKFKGLLSKTMLSGDLIVNDTTLVGTIMGKPSEKKGLDLSYLHKRIFDTIRENIYSKDVLNPKQWLEFSSDLKKLCAKANDDIELYIGFSMLSSSLPFSHLFLMMQGDMIEKEKDEETKVLPTVYFEEKDKDIAYLRISNFSSSEKELSEAFPKIVSNKEYKYLIIDLRNNGGGGIEAANEFGRHIINEPLDIGYFVTNKLDYSGFNASQFALLPEAKPKTTEEFISELKNGKGAKLVFSKSDLPVFSGKIYILTNGGTGSTCEPIVYLLKGKKIATIVGKNTAGAMLSGAFFNLDTKYKLFLPIADFYTFDGIRLDKLGVKPDIETLSEEALNKTLEMIREENKK